MRRHSVPCVECRLEIGVGLLDFLPPDRNVPQITCPHCGSGQFLSLRTRLLGVAVTFVFIVSGIVCLAEARKRELIPHFDAIPDRYVDYSFIALVVLLGLLSFPLLARHYGVWRAWTADSKYHIL